jgi:pilus assembly protein FimV
MVRPTLGDTQHEDLALDDLELSALASDLSEDINHPGDAELDISLDLGDFNDESGIDQDSVPVEGMESLDLDLPELDSEQLASELTGAEAARAIPNPETTSIGLSPIEAPVSADGPDLTSDLESELDHDDLQAQLDELSDLSVLDADFSDMIEESAVTEQPSEPGDDTLDQPISLDEVLDMDLGDEESITLDELEGFDVDDSDEVATKLDLARAYVEMGDRDGARSILGEVRDEGNAEQKGEAEKLLGSLD